MSNMRAKMVITGVEVHKEGESETLKFSAVCKSGCYEEGGFDENNTFSTYTPSADLKMLVNNPALAGKFEVGEEYYLDFVKA